MTLSPKYIEDIKHYPVECIVCEEVNYHQKSILQEQFGILDSNRVNCPNCNASFNLTFDEERDLMYIK